jgi:hypothetical protein
MYSRKVASSQVKRRGYEHGAEEVFRAVAAALPQSLCSMIERWLESDVKTWRIANLRGVDSTRQYTPHFDPNAVKEDTEEPFWY